MQILSFAITAPMSGGTGSGKTRSFRWPADRHVCRKISSLTCLAGSKRTCFRRVKPNLPATNNITLHHPERSISTIVGAMASIRPNTALQVDLNEASTEYFGFPGGLLNVRFLSALCPYLDVPLLLSRR